MKHYTDDYLKDFSKELLLEELKHTNTKLIYSDKTIIALILTILVVSINLYSKGLWEDLYNFPLLLLLLVITGGGALFIKGVEKYKKRVVSIIQHKDNDED